MENKKIKSLFKQPQDFRSWKEYEQYIQSHPDIRVYTYEKEVDDYCDDHGGYGAYVSGEIYYYYDVKADHLEIMLDDVEVFVCDQDGGDKSEFSSGLDIGEGIDLTEDCLDQLHKEVRS